MISVQQSFKSLRLLRKEEKNMDLGTNLKQLRKERNLAQEELAECLGVSPQTVSKWENNLSMPDVSCLPVLADYFGITVDALLMHNINRKDDMKEFSTKIHALANEGKMDQAYDKLKSSIKNWALSASMNHLMSWVSYSFSKEKTGAEKQNLLEEAVMYADRTIRLDAGETSRTSQAKMTKCFCMVDLDRRVEAIKIANTLPSVYSSRERVLAKVSEGVERTKNIKIALQYLDELRTELS